MASSYKWNLKGQNPGYVDLQQIGIILELYYH